MACMTWALVACTARLTAQRQPIRCSALPQQAPHSCPSIRDHATLKPRRVSRLLVCPSHPRQPILSLQLLSERLPQLRQPLVGTVLAERRVPAGHQLCRALQGGRRRLPVHNAWVGGHVGNVGQGAEKICRRWVLRRRSPEAAVAADSSVATRWQQWTSACARCKLRQPHCCRASNAERHSQTQTLATWPYRRRPGILHPPWASDSVPSAPFCAISFLVATTQGGCVDCTRCETPVPCRAGGGAGGAAAGAAAPPACAMIRAAEGRLLWGCTDVWAPLHRKLELKVSTAINIEQAGCPGVSQGPPKQPVSDPYGDQWLAGLDLDDRTPSPHALGGKSWAQQGFGRLHRSLRQSCSHLHPTSSAGQRLVKVRGHCVMCRSLGHSPAPPGALRRPTHPWATPARVMGTQAAPSVPA